jgi:hypothetical protein
LRAVLELEPGSLDLVDTERDQVEVSGVEFRRVFNPDVRVVRYRYTGGGDDSVDLVPTAGEALDSVRRARRGLPVRDMTIRIPLQDEVRLFENHLDYDDLSLISGWEALIRDLVWVALGYDDSQPCIWNGVLDGDLARVFLEGSPSASDPAPGLPAYGVTWPGILDVDVDIRFGFWGTTYETQITSFCAYTVFLANKPSVARHEYGHVYDRGHPSGDGYLGSELHTFPRYELPDYGHAVPDGCGEYGVDVEAYVADPASTAVKDPDRFSDSMVLGDRAAEAGRWPSPYLWRGLARQFLTHAAALRASFGARPEFDAAPPRPRPRLFVAGTLDLRSGELTWRLPVHHRPTLRGLPVGYPTKVTLRLLDADGEELHREPLCALGRLPGRLHFAATPPLPPGTARLVIADDETTYADLVRPDKGPVVEDFVLDRVPTGGGAPKPGEAGAGDGSGTVPEGAERWRLRWKAGHPEGRDLHLQARFSADGGASWQPLSDWVRADGEPWSGEPQPKGDEAGEEPRTGSPPVSGELTVDAAPFPGGAECRVRLLVGDGFNTVHADSEPFARKVPPPKVEILSPAPDTEIPAGRALLLEAAALLHGGGPAADADVSWSSDRQGDLGRGRFLVTRLDAGRHRLAVRVSSSVKGSSGEATVTVIARAAEAPP